MTSLGRVGRILSGSVVDNTSISLGRDQSIILPTNPSNIAQQSQQPQSLPVSVAAAASHDSLSNKFGSREDSLSQKSGEKEYLVPQQQQQQCVVALQGKL
jgi:hypothetical protein